MLRALSLAAQGLGYVEPNPMVGCVLVTKDNVEIGSGYHEQFGSFHAERNAILDVQNRGNASQLPGATAYVTLEPCCHHGKTPPCTEALIQAKVGRVVLAMKDPFSEVAGGGMQSLIEAGIEVVAGVEQALAEELNAPYLRRLADQRPWLIGKWAMTLDGKIATHKQDSQWISSPTSRAYVHKLRSRVDGVMVGIGTALQDDPLLTARSLDEIPRVATRIVVDSKARLPLDSKLVQSAEEFPTLVVVGPNAAPENCEKLSNRGVEVLSLPQYDAQERLAAMMKFLAVEKQATNILCEGGGKLLGSCNDAGFLDELDVFIAPKIVGGLRATSPVEGNGLGYVCDSPEFHLLEQQLLEDDIHARYRRLGKGR